MNLQGKGVEGPPLGAFRAESMAFLVIDCAMPVRRAFSHSLGKGERASFGVCKHQSREFTLEEGPDSIISILLVFFTKNREILCKCENAKITAKDSHVLQVALSATAFCCFLSMAEIYSSDNRLICFKSLKY